MLKYVIYLVLLVILIYVLKKLLFKYYHKDLYYLYLKHISELCCL